MSPMLLWKDTSKKLTVLFLVTMFLCADLLLPQTQDGWQVLESENQVSHVISNHYVLADTYINESSPNSNYNSSDTGYLIPTEGDETRILLDFPMNFTSSDIIYNASVELTCMILSGQSTSEISVYPARLNQGWNSTHVSWNYYANNQLWTQAGVDDDADRFDWEPPTIQNTAGVISINVTSLAQQAAKNNLGKLRLILAATGTSYSCDLSETQTSSNQPVLVIDSSTGTPTSGGAVEFNLPIEDGAPWMTSDFILTAETTPTIAYKNHTASDVELHLSHSSDWKDGIVVETERHYSTLWNSFQTSGSSGSFTIPSSDEFSNGTNVYARIRSIDTNLQTSAWQETSFILPSHSITDNGDGTATLTIEASDLGLEADFIEDASASQTSVSTNFGTSQTVDTSMTASKEVLGHIRLRLDQLGLHDNLTIVDSSMTYIRSSYSGNSIVSLHGMEESGLWIENEITWNQMSNAGVSWYDGGRSNGTATIDILNANQSSSTFEFNLTQAVQNYLDVSDAEPMDMFVALRGKYESYSNGESLIFHSTETSTGNDPNFQLTYKWGSGAPSPVTITAPEDGLAMWNKTGDNLSGNTQPSLNWSISSSSDNILFQIARDEDFRLQDLVLDTRVDNDFSPTDGTFTMNGSRTLSKGNMYFWRMATVDSSGHYGSWTTSSFIVSNLESTYLGNDRYEFRIRHGNGTNDNQYPECMDTFIDSSSVNANYNGDSEMSIEYNNPDKTTILLGCNLVSNLLPAGYAVESAQLRITLTDAPYSSPVIGVWESRQNNWSDDDATWSNYDGSNSWATSGANGWERGSLLSSLTLGGTYYGGDVVQFNVTQAVQNSMRDGRRVDFIIDQIGVPSGGFSSAYFNTAESTTAADRPEITFVYMPGSNAVPQNPTLISPVNGSWSIGSGVDLTPISTPQFEWNFTGGMSIGGWIVQIDNVSTFDSGNAITYTSWNDAGFDVQNETFTPSSSLTTGKSYHWRVRAISATNQIGNWSSVNYFHLPDLTTWVENSTTAAVEIHHHEALPQLQIPHLYDTYVIENGSGASSTYANSQTLRVGRHSNGYNAAALLKIPLSAIPQPTNSRVVNAELNVFSDLNSDQSMPIAVRPVLVNWNESANSTTYNGVNNWTQLGGRSIGNDVGLYSDIVETVTDDWMNWDVTELVQLAIANSQTHLSVMLYAPSSTSSDALLYSTSYPTASKRPWLNLTWSSGAASTPTVAAVNSLPANNAVMWDTNSHAVQANFRPTMSWTYSGSNITAWRLFILQNANDDMQGLYTYDSRVNTSAFDLQNLQFTPPSDLDFSEEIRWMVQPVRDGMIGPRSSSSNFYIPTVVGGEVNSTDAHLMIQEGSMIDALNYPTATQDTYLDSGNTLSNQGSSNALFVGRSANSYNTASLRSTSLVSIQLSSVPLPTTYEVVNATLDLDVTAFTGSPISVSVSEMLSTWSESSLWAYPAGNTSAWQGVGAYHSADSDAINDIQTVNTTGLVQFNITAILQHALASGQTTLNVILQPEEDSNGNVVGRAQFASSEHNNITLRPRINMTYRTAPSWAMPAPGSLLPADGAILWDTTSPLPAGQDTSYFSMTPAVSNETRFVYCKSDEPRFSVGTECFDTNDPGQGQTFTSSNNTLEINNIDKGDFWTYWRVRSDQNHRIGEWSAIHSFRNPNDIGTNNSGNYTVNFTRGTVFSASGLLPEAHDVSLSTNQTSTAGAAASMNLGFSSTGESQIFVEFDLSDIHFPSNVMPTNVILKLYRSSLTGNSATTVSAHACNSFDESTVVWSTKPTCSTTEITRTTLTLLPPNQWIDWDITGLAQDNIANGNYTFAIMLKSVGTPLTAHTFASAESASSQFWPTLSFEYVDNVNNITPPSQPSLNTPNDGDVLYNVTNGLLSSNQYPTLSWNPVSGASGYLLTISNETGVYKFRSWEQNSGISGTTFQFSNALTPGEIFTWWVSAFNQSIPGASSARWTFAIGDPTHTYNNNEIYTYEFQTGNEVESFGHTNIQDSTLNSEFPDVNLGDSAYLQSGTFCGTLHVHQCRLVFSLDPSQIPFDTNQSVHSASLGLYVNDWESAQSATLMTFRVYPLLTSSWSQSGSTWNESSSGVAWSTPGLGSGVEYGSTPISTITMSVGQTGWVWFDIGVVGMNLANTQGWVIIGTSNVGVAHAQFYSSEYQGNSALRPKILFNTTNVSTVTVTPGGNTIDADSTQLFAAVAQDFNSVTKNVLLEWSASSGSIGSNGLFTPSAAGTQTVQACFGLVCGTQTIIVTAGAPVTLQVTPLTATITADETLTITANMVDQHGNPVTGVSLTYTPSNGSMSPVMPNIFQPYAVGQHTILVSHPASGNSVTIDVTVTNGAPAYFEVSGCEGTVPAGVWCEVSTQLFDQFGNLLDIEDAGALTWTTTNGNYSDVNDEYYPDHVGSWHLNLSSAIGLTYSLPITVGHGQMAYLEITSSDLEITADEIIYLNTTRIDIRGNRLPVYLPSNNWTKIQDGILTPGQPASWEPKSRGSKVLEARYEDKTTQITIVVLDGQIQRLILLIDGEEVSGTDQEMTADETMEIKVRATDSKGNIWELNAEWIVNHPSIVSATSTLEEYQGGVVIERSVIFSPYKASTSAYTIRASFTQDNTTHTTQFEVMVSAGVLETVNLDAMAGDGIPNTQFEISADDYIQFAITLTDAKDNPVDSSNVRWLLYNRDTDAVSDITVAMLYHGLMWNATKVGNYEIVAYDVSSTNYNISDSVLISVYHGDAIELILTSTNKTIVAGSMVEFAVTGKDADGNLFDQNVEWFEDGDTVEGLESNEDVDGAYQYTGTIAGIHTLSFEYGIAQSSVEIDVRPQSITARLEVELSATTVEQLGSFEVYIRAFDMYDNEIEVPSSVQVDASGRGTVSMMNSSVWKVTTLDEGTQSVTINVGPVLEKVEYSVTGTLEGFFEAGGTLYYVGAVLGAIALLGAIIGLVVFMRSNNTDWDLEEDEEDDEDDERPVQKPTPAGLASGPTGAPPTSGPSVPPPSTGPSGPPPVEVEEVPEEVEEEEAWDYTQDESYRVDEEGTEWYQDDEGTWWYRGQNEEDWSAWEE
jgi:hypothetical protein